MVNNSATIDSLLRRIKKYIPHTIFKKAAPYYHWLLSLLGAFVYGFPSHGMKIIGVTGTKGKSTTVYMINKIFKDAGYMTASLGSLGYTIGDQSWSNTLKMTMPGRFKIQKFLAQARRAAVTHVILEVTSEGIAQHRLTGIAVDCAVLTNLHPEHIESHGSFELYKRAKQLLFKKTKNIHVLNEDDPYFEYFNQFPARKKIAYGTHKGDITMEQWQPHLKIQGLFNVYNALAALAVGQAYGLHLQQALRSLEAIDSIPGRVEIIRSRQGWQAVVDYAHTPESLEAVYSTFKDELAPTSKMLCVLGAAGGGRDIWKRPRFGQIAQRYCDQIFLTNEDPYEEDPNKIVDQIIAGFDHDFKNYQVIMDRKEAIETALEHTKNHDIVMITGKGSETSMAIGHTKIPWSDKKIVEDYIHRAS